MKVKELIAQLQKFDPEKEVIMQYEKNFYEYEYPDTGASIGKIYEDYCTESWERVGPDEKERDLNKIVNIRKSKQTVIFLQARN